MRYFEAATTIAAPPEAVWSVLVDGASWDSGVDEVRGRVTAYEPPRRLRFSGGLPMGRSFRRFAEGLRKRVEAGG